MTVTIIIIAFTALLSIRAFKERNLFQKLQFNPYIVKQNNEWYRFITHGFIHADWEHLIFNMLSFYFFADEVELFLGSKIYFVLFYLAALVFASSTTFFKHKNDPHYNSIGASGAVSAIIFASILFNPVNPIMIMPIPIPIPAFVYAILFVLYSSFRSKKGGDNINHDAHLMGALFGFVIPIIFQPELLKSFISSLPFFH